MRIEVAQWKVSNERKLWVFTYHEGRGLCLVTYSEQTRETSRHKWVGPIWDSHDERYYASKIQRPETIPESVLLDARDQLKQQIDECNVFIGWYNKESQYDG